MRASLIVVACLLLVAPLATFAQTDEKEVSVPLSSLMLFTSGVGYFQHDGVVDGNAAMTLTFSAGQINDLLKSLVLRDLDGGAISSVTYSSRDPITRTLQGFSIDLTTNPTLAGLLTQTRGEMVEATLTGGTLLQTPAVTLKLAGSPVPTAKLCGCVTICGASTTGLVTWKS